MANKRQEKKRASQEPKAPPRLSRAEVDDLIATLKELGPDERAEYLEAFSDSMAPEVRARVEQSLVPCVALVPVGCRAVMPYTRHEEQRKYGRVRRLFERAQCFHLRVLVELATGLLTHNPLEIIVFLVGWVRGRVQKPTRQIIWMHDGRKRKFTRRAIRARGQELAWLNSIAAILPKKHVAAPPVEPPPKEPEVMPCTALVPRSCTTLVRYTWPEDQARRQQAQELFLGVGYEQIHAAYHAAKDLLSNDPLRVEFLYLQWLARQNPQRPDVPAGPAEYEISAARESLRECLFGSIIRGKLEAFAAASLATDPCKVLREHVAAGRLDDSDPDILELLDEGPQMLLKKEERGEGKVTVVVQTIETRKQEEIKAYGLELMRQEEELRALVEADDPKAAFLERIGKLDLFLSVNEVQRVLADMNERAIQHLISEALCGGEGVEFDPLDILAGLGIEESAASLPAPFEWPGLPESTSADFDFGEIDLLSLIEGSDLSSDTQTLEEIKKQDQEQRTKNRRDERQRMRRRVIAAIRGQKGQSGSTTFHSAGIVSLNRERRDMLAELLREDPREIKRMGLPPDVLAALNHVYRERKFAQLTASQQARIRYFWGALQEHGPTINQWVVQTLETIVQTHRAIAAIHERIEQETFFTPNEEADEREFTPRSDDFISWQAKNPQANEPLWYPAVPDEAPAKPGRHRKPKRRIEASLYEQAMTERARWREFQAAPYDEREYQELVRQRENLLVE